MKKIESSGVENSKSPENQKPSLFIHGGYDFFITPEMYERLNETREAWQEAANDAVKTLNQVIGIGQKELKDLKNNLEPTQYSGDRPMLKITGGFYEDEKSTAFKTTLPHQRVFHEDTPKDWSDIAGQIGRASEAEKAYIDAFEDAIAMEAKLDQRKRVWEREHGIKFHLVYDNAAGSAVAYKGTSEQFEGYSTPLYNTREELEEAFESLKRQHNLKQDGVSIRYKE